VQASSYLYYARWIDTRKTFLDGPGRERFFLQLPRSVDAIFPWKHLPACVFGQSADQTTKVEPK